MGSCSAINTMYGGKKSRRYKRKNKKMRGGSNVLERASDATIGTTLGVVSAVKDTTGEVVSGVASEGVSMLSKLGSIFSATGEKIRDTGSQLYSSLAGEEVQEDKSLIGEVGNILSSTGEKLKESSSKLYNEIVDGEQSGGRRRRRHKTSKLSRHKRGGKHRNTKSKRRSKRHSKNMNMRKRNRSSRRGRY